MKCPKCQHKRTTVTNTIREDIPRGSNKPMPVGVTKRTRECQNCAEKFHTYEFIDCESTQDLVDTFALLS